MSIASDWRADVDDRIAATLEETARAIAPIGTAADDLTDVIGASAAGGKRLRAILVLASHSAHGGADHDRAVGVAAALELFQTAALLHDDVLDDSDTRRGRPAAHRVLAALHERHRWHGSATEFGAAGGILAGDIVLMASQRALHAALDGAADGRRTTTAALFTEMTELVTAGQYLDMRIAAAPLGDIASQAAEIRATMRSKTASYSAEFPLALGAALAGAGAGGVAAVREVGVPLGVAFQLRDDVLGLTGAPEVTGKPTGDDLREGKRTLLVHYLWQAADAAARARLESCLGRQGASDEDVARVIADMAAFGALAQTEREIDHLATTALTRLESLELGQPGLSVLTEVFHAAIHRDS